MIDVRPSSVHGQGAFASKALVQGECLGTYEGRRYSARQARRRDWNAGLTYVFGLTDGSLIDAAVGGNATRHLNHSCAPNCVAYEETGADGSPTVAFYALRDIEEGEELFLDYCLVVDEADDPAAFRCACGAGECRGTMVAPA